MLLSLPTPIIWTTVKAWLARCNFRVKGCFKTCRTLTSVEGMGNRCALRGRYRYSGPPYLLHAMLWDLKAGALFGRGRTRSVPRGVAFSPPRPVPRRVDGLTVALACGRGRPGARAPSAGARSSLPVLSWISTGHGTLCPVSRRSCGLGGDYPGMRTVLATVPGRSRSPVATRYGSAFGTGASERWRRGKSHSAPRRVSRRSS